MSDTLLKNDEYRTFIQDLKQRVQSAQIKAAIFVNSELLSLYWDLDRLIVEKQQAVSWGDRILQQVSQDLKAEFSNMT